MRGHSLRGNGPAESGGGRWSRREFVERAGSFALLTSVASTIDLLAACSGTPSSGGAGTGIPVKGGHLISGVTAEVSNFNTAIATSLTQNGLANLLLFDGLLSTNSKGELIPSIASLPNVSSDGTTYTFSLRPDVKWSDGTPLTSADALFTYGLMFAPDYKDVPSARRSVLEANIESLQAPDPHTFVVKTKQVWAPFLTLHSQYGIMPAHVFQAMTGKQVASADFNTNPTVVSGMYKFVSLQKGQQLTLARNDSYYGTKSYLDTYIQTTIADSSTLPALLEAGEIDVAIIDPSQAGALRSVKSIGIASYPTSSMPFYAYNLAPDKPASVFFSDRSVRQALLYALDRQEIVKAVLDGQGTVPLTWEPPASWAFNEQAKPVYSHDAKRAASLLDAAGWKPGSDGIRTNNGRRMEFEMDVISSIKTHTAMAQIIQEQWKTVGVDLRLKTAAVSTVIQNYLYSRNFDLSMGQVNWPDDPDESNMFNSSSTASGGLNAMDYVNPQLDHVFDQAAHVVDRAKRKVFYDQIQDILNEDLPAVPLVVINAVIAYNKRVHASFSPHTRAWQRGAWVSDRK